MAKPEIRAVLVSRVLREVLAEGGTLLVAIFLLWLLNIGFRAKEQILLVLLEVFFHSSVLLHDQENPEGNDQRNDHSERPQDHQQQEIARGLTAPRPAYLIIGRGVVSLVGRE